MKLEVNEVFTCSTLAYNFQTLFGRVDIDSTEEGFIDLMNAAFSDVENIVSPLEIFNVPSIEICREFEIPLEVRSLLRERLNQAATTYVICHLYKFSRHVHGNWLAQIDRLGKTAKKLQQQISECDSDFFEVLEFFNHFEVKEENEPSVSEYFNSLLIQLRILERLRSNINLSQLGTSYGFGLPSRRKNIELNFWIKTLYNFWHNELKRDMARDKTNFSGRKRFLDFVEACIMPLHPDVVSDPYSPQERLDTALKVFQKELKIHGENAIE